MSEKMILSSKDVLTERIEQLRETFPEVFTEGKVDFEKLKEVLGEEVAADRERYGLSWAGKGESVRNVQTPSVGTLTPDRGESDNFDDTENLFIEGDNLEILKLLQKSYHGRDKMIYIDPPYNGEGMKPSANAGTNGYRAQNGVAIRCQRQGSDYQQSFGAGWKLATEC